MINFARCDRLAGMGTAYGYFGGTSHKDAFLTLGEYTNGLFYLEVSGQSPIYQKSDGFWTNDFTVYESFQSMLGALSINLFLESGQLVVSPEQAITPLSSELLNKFSQENHGQSFEEFTAWRHQFAGDN